MRGATLVTVQHHQILRLPRNSEFKMSAENPWIASAYIETIRRWSEDNPTIKSSSRTRRFGDLVPSWRRSLYWKIQHFALRLSPKIARNAAPATKSDTPTSPEQQRLPCNITKSCGCREKWLSWLIRIRYETSFTMLRVILQLHQILRPPLNLMIDPHHIWNVI